MKKVNELVHREVATKLHLLFPDKIVSVTEVRVSPDLSSAKVWISSLEDTDEMVKMCQKVASLIQADLAARVVLKKVPKLKFVADQTSQNVAKIEELIGEIHRRDSSDHNPRS